MQNEDAQRNAGARFNEEFGMRQESANVRHCCKRTGKQHLHIWKRPRLKFGWSSEVKGISS